VREHEIQEQEGRLTPDPFDLPKQIRSRISSCTSAHCACGDAARDIRYLWVYAGAELSSSPQSPPLSLKSWLNILDEAASLGVQWLVVSLEQDCSRFPSLWELFQWAQQTHEMNVAIHVNENTLNDEDTKNLIKLESTLTHLFVPEKELGLFDQMAKYGISVHSCTPPPEGQEQCSMPGSMLFVTTEGQLYTCGMVNGESGFCLGDVHVGFFNEILHDDTKPHAVTKAAMTRENGCMGCPPLILQEHI
jgi:radical SAM protein with 4Fe4S-binding SPASM domain